MQGAGVRVSREGEKYIGQWAAGTRNVLRQPAPLTSLSVRPVQIYRVYYLCVCVNVCVCVCRCLCISDFPTERVILLYWQYVLTSHGSCFLRMLTLIGYRLEIQHRTADCVLRKGSHLLSLYMQRVALYPIENNF